MASIAASAMKIGSSADLRAASNLSSSSEAANDASDISALFDQLLAQNVSPQTDAATAADATPGETAASPQPYSALSQNFMQALLSANQPLEAAQPKAGAARPIPAEPRSAGFPRVAALIADPAWPPRAGARPQAAPATVPKSKITDINQSVTKIPATAPAVTPATKSIAELLLAALAAPSAAPAQARTDDAAPKSQAPASPAQPRPNVVMDAKSFARLAPFVSPNALAARPGLAATASPEIATPAPPAAVIAKAAGLPQAAAPPKQAVTDQTPARFADIGNVKNINLPVQIAVAAPTPTRAQTVSQQAATPAPSITDVIEGLRAAIVGDPENTPPPALTVPAMPKPSPATSVVVASPDSTKPQAAVQMPSPLTSSAANAQATAQTVSPPIPDAKTNPPAAQFIATVDTAPTVSTVQSAVARTFAVDTKIVATPAQSATPQASVKQAPSAPQAIIQAAPQSTPDAKTNSPVAQFIASVAANPAVQIVQSAPAGTIVADTKTIATPAQSATPQTPVKQAPSAPQAIIQAAPQSTPDVKMNSPVAQFAATTDAKPAVQIAQPAPAGTIVADTKNAAAPAQSETPQAPAAKPAASAAPQAGDMKLQISVQSPTIAEAKSAPRIPSAEPMPVPAANQTQPSVRDAKQDASERQDAPRDTSADSTSQTQIQSAPQTPVQPALVADVKNIVQSVLAAQAPTAPVKSTARAETNTPARGSMAAAFAAAAARSIAPLQTSPAEPRTTPAPVSDEQSVDGKDVAQQDKNSSASVKNEPAAAAPVALNDTTQIPAQPQTADNTISLPQAAVTLTNDPNAAATQATTQPAPHLTANISASLQVGPKDQAAPTHAQQADLSALAINIVAKSQGGSRHFDIRLDPAEMGRVEVRLSIDESGKATAHLSAEKPQTLDLLQRDAPALTRALKESGLDLSQNGLNFSLKGQHQHNGGNGAQSRGTPLAVTATAAPEPSAIPLNLRADNVRLDIRV